ncbi:MAG: hypothetical protein Q9227_008696 [Pyrenula ochraceoflavens]
MDSTQGSNSNSYGGRRHPSIVTTDTSSPSRTRPPVPETRDLSLSNVAGSEQSTDLGQSTSPNLAPASLSPPLATTPFSSKTGRRRSYGFLPRRKSTDAQDQGPIVASPVSSDNSPVVSASTDQSQDQRSALVSGEKSLSTSFKTTGWKSGIRYNIEELRDALSLGDRNKVEKCLNAGISVDYCQYGVIRGNLPGTWNLVDRAVIANRLDVLKIVLRFQPDLTGNLKARFIEDQRGKFGEEWFKIAGPVSIMSFTPVTTSQSAYMRNPQSWIPPLHLAAMLGHLDVVKLFLKEEKCDPNMLDYKTRTTLHHAVSSGKTEIIDLLLDSGAQIDWGDHLDVSPLQQAVLLNKFNMVKRLVERGALLNKFDSFGETALYEAAARDKTEICQYLAQAGADLESKNGNGLTAFFTAASRFHTEVMDILSAHGADIDAADRNGCTPLLRALMAKNTKLAGILLAYGADIDISDNQGWTPLDIAMINRDDSLIGLLLLNGANLSLADAQGNLVIHRAAARGTTSLMRHLLATKFPDVHNNFGETPLHLAATKKHVSIVRLLLRRGATADLADNFGHAPLHRAIMSGSFAIVRELCHYGVRVDPEKISDIFNTDVDNQKKNKQAELIKRFLCDKYPELQSKVTFAATGATVLPDHTSGSVASIDISELNLMRNKQGKQPIDLKDIAPKQAPEKTQKKPSGADSEASKADDPFEASIPEEPLAQVINNILVQSGNERNLAAEAGINIAGNIVSGVIQGLV